MDVGIPQSAGLELCALECVGGRWGGSRPLPEAEPRACLLSCSSQVEKRAGARTPGFPGFVQLLQLKYLLGLCEAYGSQPQGKSTDQPTVLRELTCQG